MNLRKDHYRIARIRRRRRECVIANRKIRFGRPWIRGKEVRRRGARRAVAGITRAARAVDGRVRVGETTRRRRRSRRTVKSYSEYASGYLS